MFDIIRNCGYPQRLKRAEERAFEVPKVRNSNIKFTDFLGDKPIFNDPKPESKIPTETSGDVLSVVKSIKIM